MAFISIHAPLTGRDICNVVLTHVLHISIHAPLTGRDSRFLPRWVTSV